MTRPASSASLSKLCVQPSRIPASAPAVSGDDFVTTARSVSFVRPPLSAKVMVFSTSSAPSKARDVKTIRSGAATSWNSPVIG